MMHALGIIILSMALSYTGGVFLPKLAMQYGLGLHIATLVVVAIAFELAYPYIRRLFK